MVSTIGVAKSKPNCQQRKKVYRNLLQNLLTNKNTYAIFSRTKPNRVKGKSKNHYNYSGGHEEHPRGMLMAAAYGKILFALISPARLNSYKSLSRT